MADEVVETDARAVLELARELRLAHPDTAAFAQAAFEFVRDEVMHSLDAQDSRVTLTATDVLTQRVGLCFAKSHLLAAILRSEALYGGGFATRDL